MFITALFGVVITAVIITAYFLWHKIVYDEQRDQEYYGTAAASNSEEKLQKATKVSYNCIYTHSYTYILICT